MPLSTWDDENTAELTRLWADGHSVTRIGEALGLTRNAIVGKVWRLKLPEPLVKLPVICDRVYIRQSSEITKAKAAERERLYRAKRRAKEQAANRARSVQMGFSKTSKNYRVHLPKAAQMSKSELRAMLSQAVQNTAAMGIAA